MSDSSKWSQPIPQTRTPSRRPDAERHEGLVARVAARDEAAFADLYELYFPRVYAYCLKRVGNATEAEDLAQETFVQLYRSAGSYEGRSSLLTWIFGIACNVCSRYFRQRARWVSGQGDAVETAEQVAGSDEPGQERRVDAARVLSRCSEVLETSRRPAHREIFRLRYAEMRSIRSIARQVGKTDAAVKVSLRRTRIALASRVSEIGSVLGADVLSA